MENIPAVKITQRLHFRIALFVITTIIIIFGLFSVYQIYSYRQKLISMEIESSEELGRTLTSSLEIAMLNSDLNSIQYSFNEISKSDDIIRVFLLNTKGEIRASSPENSIGLKLEKENEGCRDCHLTDKSLQGSIELSINDNDILRVVTPVINKPACHSCHSKDARLNGLLVLDHSLVPVKAEIISNIRLAGSIALASILIMMFLFRWYIKRHVLNRIVYLESLARMASEYRLDVDIEVKGEDELASLARSFDNMKNGLRLSMREIENHRSYLAYLLENLVDGILIIDDTDHVAFINRPFDEILELEKESLQTGDQFNCNRDKLHSLAPIGRMIESVQKTGDNLIETIKLKTPGNSDKHLEVHVGKLILPPRLKPEIIVVVRDITARVTIENQVYQAEKLSTIGRLAAGLAHEINNPMASILTCTEGLLKSGFGNVDDSEEYLKIIRESARRCKIITQKLLDYSALSTMKKENVDINEVLREAVSLLKFEADKKKVTIKIPEPLELPSIKGSRDSLIQVFVNLILNSIQAVESDGLVNIDVKNNGNFIYVSVEDNGRGIRDEDLKRVFDPFFTTKAVGIGTGLGLSVSQGIIKKHDGKIEIIRAKPGYTTFKISLPVGFREEVTSDE